MADQFWKLGAGTNPVSLLTTGLNALANNSAAISAADDNTGGSPFGDFELVVDFDTTPPSDGGPVRLYILRTVDGTNYDDGAAGATPAVSKNSLAGTFLVRNVLTIQRIVLPLIELPPRQFKALLVNETGQPFSATGHTLKLLKYTYTSV